MIEKKEKKLHTFAICAYGDSPYLEECMVFSGLSEAEIGDHLLHLHAQSLY